MSKIVRDFYEHNWRCLHYIGLGSATYRISSEQDHA